MKIISTPELLKSQKESVIWLWNREYPVQLNVSAETFEEYLSASGNHLHLLMLDDAAEIIGWACVFDREGNRWFSIIINSLYHGLGLGTMLLNQLKKSEVSLNGWVIDHDHYTKKNGEFYNSPLSFYLKKGFTICPEIRFENEKMSALKICWEK
ncbi:MAG: GNAT family N-acetyltransferase [Saprospiraceae bacterium]